MLSMKAISKVYRTELVQTHALRELDLSVRAGEFLAVTGPSGSGKTTLLNIAGLLEDFSSGEYRLDGVDVKGLPDSARSRLRNQKIGFIFQSFNLIADLNLFDNVDVPLRYRGLPRAERKRRIERALERVGLASRMRHYPAELSGGQQQRAARRHRGDRDARSRDRRARPAQRAYRRRHRDRYRAGASADPGLRAAPRSQRHGLNGARPCNSSITSTSRGAASGGNAC
jgi:ABC-type uncharacterized transport system YnjBCD ATPase subunit